MKLYISGRGPAKMSVKMRMRSKSESVGEWGTETLYLGQGACKKSVKSESGNEKWKWELKGYYLIGGLQKNQWKWEWEVKVKVWANEEQKLYILGRGPAKISVKSESVSGNEKWKWDLKWYYLLHLLNLLNRQWKCEWKAAVGFGSVGKWGTETLYLRQEKCHEMESESGNNK